MKKLMCLVVGAAVAAFCAGCARSPQSAFRDSYDAAQKQSAEGDIQGAIASYRAAIHANPISADAHNNLGALLYEIGQTDQAVLEYERALQLNPDLSEAHNNLGVALLSTGRTTQAVAQFRHAVARKPGFNDARFNLCLGLEILSQFDEALKQCQLVAQSEPSRPGLADAVERLQRKRVEAGGS